jgi:hypothetical protein
MFVDRYYLNARLFPTVLTSIPTLLVYYKYIVPLYHGKLENVIAVLPAITTIVLSSAIIFLLTQINRFISKEIYQRIYFNEEINMPTTNLLLKSNSEFEISIKQKIEDKIKTKFELRLLSETEELSDVIRARKLIVTAVSQIKNSLRENSLLLQHNIEYGFSRNLIGGSTIALVICIFMLVLSYNSKDISMIYLSWILSIMYFLPIAFSKIILDRLSKNYAKILFEQFLTIK